MVEQTAGQGGDETGNDTRHHASAGQAVETPTLHTIAHLTLLSVL